LRINLPNFRSWPWLVVGIPIERAILPLAPEIPRARFQENERPNFLPMHSLLSKRRQQAELGDPGGLYAWLADRTTIEPPRASRVRSCGFLGSTPLPYFSPDSLA